ncbi:MAG: thiamine pyrophosphate-dependent dehydrogenase E1 component subunit alpha [Chloroflexota bacterium]|nr:MAG: pyruvate dehydrogenase [Chloroflexota bacterium]
MATQVDVQVGKSDLTIAQLLDVYRFMVLTREVDGRIRTLYLQGKVTGGVYSQLGHEAISVGTAFALRPTDIVAPMHRDLGTHLVRGMELGQILAQIMARENTFTHGKDNALHIGSYSRLVLPQISMLGTSIPLAAGAALTAKQRGEDRVALTYVGDGAVNTGDFHEGLNFAAALTLPFILVVENNQYAYSTHVSKQIACEHISQRAAGYGIPGVRVDGNDVLAVYRATRQATERARQGLGPTLIECVTMRMRGHSENDDASYVPPEVLEKWRARDPIERFERWLGEGGILELDAAAGIKADVAQQVSEAADWALGQPMPEPEVALQGVYRTPVSKG